MLSSNPYKGLFPYTLADEKRFFGRDTEAFELVEMIKNSQLVIIYGESGAGKTSLINAKLFPELERQYYFPVYIRINYSDSLAPLEQFRNTVYAELKKWDENVPDFNDQESLIEYAARTKIFNGLIKPILFLDQFEEIFTLGTSKVDQVQIDAYLKQLGDLIELRLPYNPNSAQAPEEARQNILNYSVVLSLRQDFIAYLDDLRDEIPSVSNNRYRIKKFTRAQALLAIKGPDGVVDDETAELIIANVSQLDPRIASRSKTTNPQELNRVGIDPTLLSLYCYQLYEEAPDNSGTRKITATQVPTKETVAILEHYYHTSLKRRNEQKAVEKYLITSDGRRVLFSLKDFIKKSGLSQNEVIALKNKTAIFRTYGSGDLQDLELAHDQIAKIALFNKSKSESKKIWRKTLISIGCVLLIFGGIIAYFWLMVKDREQSTRYKSQQDTIIKQKENLKISLVQLAQSRYSLLLKDSLYKVLKTSDSLKSNTLKSQIITLGREKKAVEDIVTALRSSLDSSGTVNSTLLRNYQTLQVQFTTLKDSKAKSDPKLVTKTELAKTVSLGSFESGACSPNASLVFTDDSLYVHVLSISKQNLVSIEVSKNKNVDATFIRKAGLYFKKWVTVPYKGNYFIVYCQAVRPSETTLCLIKIDIK